MRLCSECGKTFAARRSDAAFCSARCRKRAQRRSDRKIEPAPPIEAVYLADLDVQAQIARTLGTTVAEWKTWFDRDVQVTPVINFRTIVAPSVDKQTFMSVRAEDALALIPDRNPYRSIMIAPTRKRSASHKPIKRKKARRSDGHSTTTS